MTTPSNSNENKVEDKERLVNASKHSVDEILSAAEYDSLKVTCCSYVVEIEGRLQRYDEHTVGFIDTAIKVTKNYTGPKIEYLVGAGLMRINSGETLIEIIDFTVLGAEATVHASATSVGFGAKLVVADGKVSMFDVTLGFGLSSAIGILDDSVTIKLFGCGFQLGRKVNFGMFDNSFGIDFGRIIGNPKQPPA